MRLPVLVLATAFAGASLVPAAVSGPAADAAPGPPGAAPATAPVAGPLIQMFQWPWDSIAQECRNHLGPKGFGAVQVSPPQEHVQLADKGYPWYQDYQPVSYGLQSRRGGGEQFAAMVRTCKESGVEVYVDAVVNHMSGSGSAGSGPGSGGTVYEKYRYPGLFEDGDFHDCRRDITNYDDKWEVRNCELVGLADLKTESEKVRNAQIGFLNGLIDMGVSGFRVDGVKHMPPEDVAAVFGSLKGDPYVFQEVIADQTTPASEYVGNGDVTEFAYHGKVSNAFRDGSLAQLANLPDQMALPSDQAVVFIDNHDTQRSSPTLTYKDGQRYDLAVGFELAHPYGTPQLISSFAFDNPDQGPPAGDGGVTSPASCEDQRWVCEHRRPVISGMAGFHKAVTGTGLTNWWDNGGGRIAFGRGDAGFAVFNAEGGEFSQTFQSSLPAGTYCDVMTGEVADGRCTGGTVEVGGDGKFSATVAAGSGLALHAGAKVG
ncbi:alpha-amylase family protein [Saccharopolyspora erythraea]|uniref:alpha-amylase n=1 Tax=Saccharopolyspora erythraea TaxID=1836 RepID=UPI001BA82796|nr:alpha-amylase family protein [Saccharopolyspora erythraea]QUH01212.1 alpha-amylase family protein [Saccharopolyspora erythraea]